MRPAGVGRSRRARAVNCWLMTEVWMAVLGGREEVGAADVDGEVDASAGREWSIPVTGSTTRSLEAVMMTRPSGVVMAASSRTAGSRGRRSTMSFFRACACIETAQIRIL